MRKFIIIVMTNLVVLLMLNLRLYAAAAEIQLTFDSFPWSLPVNTAKKSQLYSPGTFMEFRGDAVTQRFHAGFDFGKMGVRATETPTVNDEVRASADGYVLEKYNCGGFPRGGNVLFLYHGVHDNKYYYSVYMHLHEYGFDAGEDPLVRKGDYVRRGQLIAYAGDTDMPGQTYNPHLHVSLCSDRYIDDTLEKILDGKWHKTYLHPLELGHSPRLAAGLPPGVA